MSALGNRVEPQTDRSAMPKFGWFDSAVDYLVDTTQRSILFWDVMRQRDDQYREHMAEAVPHVLDYEVELIIDGRRLERPVNFCLARIIPPADVEIDSAQRPFVVVDPRAGHGPGIGGFKAESEIGAALKAGHPCYFIGFLPDLHARTDDRRRRPRRKQFFSEKVVELHPDAHDKPCVIGNCQAGWAIMIVAALRPDLFGPIIIAGSPLALLAGRTWQINDALLRRDSFGGSWLAALASEAWENGKFDGAWLVQNFGEPESRQYLLDKAI